MFSLNFDTTHLSTVGKRLRDEVVRESDEVNRRFMGLVDDNLAWILCAGVKHSDIVLIRYRQDPLRMTIRVKGIDRVTVRTAYDASRVFIHEDLHLQS